MGRVVLWVAGGLLAVAAVIGIVGLVSGGSCGCANSNYACVAPPCPSSDGLWFAFLLIGVFGAPLLFTGASFASRSARLTRYQSRQAPVSAETSPVMTTAPPTLDTLLAGGREWAQPPSPAWAPTPRAGSGDAEGERLRQLSELDHLRQSGALTQAEFDEQKRTILGS